MIVTREDLNIPQKNITVKDIIRLCGIGEVIHVYFNDQKSDDHPSIPILTISVDRDKFPDKSSTDDIRISYAPDTLIHLLDAEVKDMSLKTRSDILFDNYSISAMVLYIDRP